MPTLICQRRNSDHTVLAVQIEIPMKWTNKKTKTDLNLIKGNYLIRDHKDIYQISGKEFEDTYLVRKIIS